MVDRREKFGARRKFVVIVVVEKYILNFKVVNERKIYKYYGYSIVKEIKMGLFKSREEKRKEIEKQQKLEEQKKLEKERQSRERKEKLEKYLPPRH